MRQPYCKWYSRGDSRPQPPRSKRGALYFELREHENWCGRLYELSCIAKEVTNLAVHFRCSAVITEHLNIQSQDHGKGRSFNRAVNNQWTRKGFILPLVRRLEAAGLRHMEVNPAYSSKMGNLLWGWPLLIPDPACAAVELGRRFLQGDPKSSERTNGGNRRKEERQAQASQDAEARTEWKRVWNQLHPKSGDTPRCTLLALRQRFPEACPSSSPFKAPQSLVSRLEPARIASDLRIYMRKDLGRCVYPGQRLSGGLPW
jgi:IS605 OrfB family transposase